MKLAPINLDKELIPVKLQPSTEIPLSSYRTMAQVSKVELKLL